MLKDFGILLGGIFVGAVTAEVIHKKCPDVCNKLCVKTREVAAGIKEAFKAGYENATRPHQTEEAVEPA